MLLVSHDALKYIISLSAVIVVILVAAIVIVAAIKAKNKGHVRVDAEFITNIISFLGGKSNISQIGVDNARLKVAVNDLTAVNTDELHKMSEKGVFITGNNVKMMFKYDSQAIKREIEKNM